MFIKYCVLISNLNNSDYVRESTKRLSNL